MRRQRASAVANEESAAEATCGAAAAAKESATTSGGNWGVESIQGVGTGNAARCLEVGLVSAWKSDGTGPENLAKQASKDVR